MDRHAVHRPSVQHPFSTPSDVLDPFPISSTKRQNPGFAKHRIQIPCDTSTPPRPGGHPKTPSSIRAKQSVQDAPLRPSPDANPTPRVVLGVGTLRGLTPPTSRYIDWLSKNALYPVLSNPLAISFQESARRILRFHFEFLPKSTGICGLRLQTPCLQPTASPPELLSVRLACCMHFGHAPDSDLESARD